MSKTKAHRIKQALRATKTKPAEINESLGLEKGELSAFVRDGDADTGVMMAMGKVMGVDGKWLRKGHEDPEAEVPEWDEAGQKVRAQRYTCGLDGKCSTED